MWIAITLLVGACPVVAQSPASPLLSLDPQRAEVRWETDRWQLWAGAAQLKDFGHNEALAREALALIRDLRLTQRGCLGSPVPVMEYWLSNGQAPQSARGGWRPSPFDPDSLKVEEVQGQWLVTDAHHTLFNFGSNEADARQALAIIHRYGFNQILYVGLGTPVMMVLLADHSQVVQGAMEQPTTLRLVEPSGQTRMQSEKLPAPGEKLASACARSGQQEPFAEISKLRARQLSAVNSFEPSVAPATSQPFNWRQVEVRYDLGEWKLVAASHVLANFHGHQEQALEALRIVRAYGFTELCRVGPPEAPFTFFLVHGQAPRGLQFGLTHACFHPDELVVRRSGDDWAIADHEQVLWRFGNREGQAQQVLQIIHHYQFDHLCRLGGAGTAGLTFLVRTR